MITLIILTTIAVFVLIIGFFDIRIPFLFRDQLTKKEKKEFLKANFTKEQNSLKTKINNIKRFLRINKDEVGYRIINDHKASKAV